MMEIYKPGTDLEVKVIYPFGREQGKSLNSREILALCHISKYLQPTTLLDIGTFEGNTALNMLANTHDHARLWTVDIGDITPIIEESGRYNNKTSQDRVGIQIKGHRLSNRITMITEDSMNLNWDELPGFDLILIDGCHKAEVVRHDTDMALTHINDGGVILWHDYGFIPDITQMLDEMYAVKQIERTRLAVWGLR